MIEARLGKIPTTPVRRLIYLLSRSSGFVERDLAAMGLGEREVGEQVRLGVGEQPGDGRKAGLEHGDHPAAVLAGRGPVGLLEDRPDGRGEHAPGRARDEVLGVPGEVDPAGRRWAIYSPRRSSADKETPGVTVDHELSQPT
jgi:hypothetical protein